MIDEKRDARLAMLVEWAAHTRARGYDVPEAETLARIADAGLHEGGDGTAVVAAWQPTIDWLLKQIKFGMRQPHTQLPNELAIPLDGLIASPRRSTFAPPAPPAPPAPAAPAAAPAAAAPEPTELSALQAWRRDGLESDPARFAQLKEGHLKQVTNSTARTEEELLKYSAVVRPFAAEIAAVFAEFAGSTGSAGSPASPPVAPVPSAAPATTAPYGTAARPDEDSQAIDPTGFAAYAYEPSTGVPTPLSLSRTTEGAALISWSAADQPCVFRVISADDQAPFNPDQARPVIATTGTTAVDEAPFLTAVRHFQVWRNPGASVSAAKIAQPLLHAFGALVSPVLDLDLREDEGRIIGQWRVLDGTQRVQVFRVPIHSAATGSGDPRYRILADQLNLGGFVDAGAARGERYLYQVYAEAAVDGIARLSTPSVVDMSVSIVHEPVRDLSFDLHDDVENPFFNLSWTRPPGGRVVVYRSAKPPLAGIEQGVQPESVLEQANLRLDDRLAHPLSDEDDRGFMRDVPWPREWTRAYFTPVVLQEGFAYVGNTVRGVRVPPVARPHLTERVNRAVLTFDWPDGADAVRVYSSPRGMDASVAIGGQPTETSFSTYKMRGGISFPAGTLDDAGCDLHLVSIAFDGGQPVTARPITINYPALLRVSYAVTPKYSMLGKLSFGITVSAALEANLPLVLVYNPHRLPLAASDGTALSVTTAEDDGTAPSRMFYSGAIGPDAPPSQGWRTDPEGWQRDVSKLEGFVRLFVNLPAENIRHIALLDPPVGKLRVLSGLKRAKGALGG